MKGDRNSMDLAYFKGSDDEDEETNPLLDDPDGTDTRKKKKAYVIWAAIVFLLAMGITGILIWQALEYRNSAILDKYILTTIPYDSPILNSAFVAANVAKDNAGQSITDSNGTALWFFSNLLLNGIATEISNSAASLTIQLGSIEAAVFNTDANGASPVLLPDTGESFSNISIIPAGAIYYQNTPYVFFEVTRNVRGQLWDPAKHKYGLAVGVNLSSFSFTRVFPDSFSYPILPVQIVAGDNEYFYCYYVHRPGLLSSNVYLARLAKSGLTSSTPYYEYWKGFGDSFASFEPELSPPIVEGVFGAVSVINSEYLKQYIMFHTGLLGDWHSIWARTAENPWGPFSAPILIYKGSNSINPWDYQFSISNVFAHTELFTNYGQDLVISYSEQGKDGYDETTFIQLNIDEG